MKWVDRLIVAGFFVAGWILFFTGLAAGPWAWESFAGLRIVWIACLDVRCKALRARVARLEE